MIENESQIRDIISQYDELLKKAQYIVRKESNQYFIAEYFYDEPRVLSSRDNVGKMINVQGYDSYDDEPCHYKILLAWLLMSDEEIDTVIEEKKKRREEEVKKREAEEQAIAEKKIEECERRTLALLIEKYGVDGGKKND